MREAEIRRLMAVRHLIVGNVSAADIPHAIGIVVAKHD